MNNTKMEKRNRYVIKMRQKHPEMSDQKIMDLAYAKYGGSQSRQRVKQIWNAYLGRYDLVSKR